LVSPLCARFHLSGELALEERLEGLGVGSELGDTITELLDGHLVLVEVEAEESLVVDVRLLLDVETGGLGGIELLGDVVVGVEEVLKQVGLSKGVSVISHVSNQTDKQ
jgi:hypothetical protein